MKNSAFQFALISFFLCLFTATSFAQTEPTDTAYKVLYLVVKVDGTEYYGYILSDDGREIELNTKSIGRIFIAKSEIKSIAPVDDEEIDPSGNLKYKDYRNKGPFTTRYFLTTNALPIEQGENYALMHLYGPEVHFATSDQFSIGVMASWIASPIGVAAKYAFKSTSNTHFALGSIVASSGFLAEAKAYGGLHWATITRGDRTANISFSLGYAYADLYRLYDIGDKYDWQSESQYDEHFVRPEATSDLNAQLFGEDREWHRMAFYKPFSGSVVVGASGITHVGRKASFIFDAMVFFGTSHNVTYQDYPVLVNFNTDQGPQSETFIIGQGSVETGRSITIVAMPAMRFSNEYNKAFQIALSGFVNFNDERILSVPVPLISWMRLF